MLRKIGLLLIGVLFIGKSYGESSGLQGYSMFATDSLSCDGMISVYSENGRIIFGYLYDSSMTIGLDTMYSGMDNTTFYDLCPGYYKVLAMGEDSILGVLDFHIDYGLNCNFSFKRSRCTTEGWSSCYHIEYGPNPEIFNYSATIDDSIPMAFYYYGLNIPLFGDPFLQEPGEHYVVFTLDSLGCTDTLFFEQDSCLWAISTEVYSANENCLGWAEATPNGGVPPYTYQWNDAKNQITSKADSLCERSYTVTITDSIGCILSKWVDIPYDNCPEAIMFNITTTDVTDTSLCDGEASILLSEDLAALVTEGYVYPFFYWSGNESITDTLSVNSLCAGFQYVELTDSISLCTQKINFLITEPSLRDTTSWDFEVVVDTLEAESVDSCIMDIFTSEIDTSYIDYYIINDSTSVTVEWIITANGIIYSFTTEYLFKEEGDNLIVLTIYCEGSFKKVALENFLAVIDIDRSKIGLTQYTSYTSIKEISFLENLKVIPVPNNGNMRIESSVTFQEIEIISVLGESKAKIRNLNDNTYTLNLNLDGGIYFVVLRTQNDQLTKKIVVIE